MATSKVSHQRILTEEREMTEVQASSRAATGSLALADSEEYEEDKFDKHFWREVRNKIKETGVSYNKAMDLVRVERLKAKVEKHGKDPLFVMIDKWPKMFLEKYKVEKKYKDPKQQIPSLEYLISRLAEIILEQDTEKKYKFFRVEEEEDESERTLLHLAAEQNFLHVTRCLVNHYPNLMNLRTRDKKCSLPIELALDTNQDDTAAYLISQMPYDTVKNLFLRDVGDDDEDDEEDKQSKVFYFGNIISYRNPKTNEYGMEKTVVAVLNKLINPRWPYLPDRREEEEADEEIARALESVPDDPMNYDFEYHILEADENGREPNQRKFNQNSVSCLRLIADSENKEAVKHPVVRMLVAKKWNEFAHQWFCLKAFLYVVFLLVLSFALIYGSTRDDPTKYINSGDKLRAFCEICSVIFLMFHLFDEIGEIARDGKGYFRVWHNYLDMFGIILTFLVLPLRYAESKSQWTLASLGYIFNFLRLFKFSNVTRITGLYTTTLVKIIRDDITRFMLVFAVIFIGFCGAIFMALKVDDLQDSFSNFSSLMLAGFRALVEQQPVAEDYSKFGWLAILILLSYMGVVIVVLLNVLIAQLSYTYSEAKRVARLQYAADTMRIVTRLEYSRFASLNFRVKKYVPGDWISDEDLAAEILEYAEDRHPWENAEERITSVREIMRKIVRKGNEKEPWENLDDKLTHLTSIVEKLPSQTMDSKTEA